MPRGYVEGRWGQVHYRADGESGPAVVLVHESPLSSEEYRLALPELGRSVRAVAFDTPGYGLSDPPPEPQEIPEYAASLLEAADALGLDEFAVVGTHTGASIAVQMALQAAPGRITHAVLSGIPVMRPETRAHLLATWAPETPPQADGLWAARSTAARRARPPRRCRGEAKPHPPRRQVVTTRDDDRSGGERSCVSTSGC